MQSRTISARAAPSSSLVRRVSISRASAVPDFAATVRSLSAQIFHGRASIKALPIAALLIARSALSGRRSELRLRGERPVGSERDKTIEECGRHRVATVGLEQREGAHDPGSVAVAEPGDGCGHVTDPTQVVPGEDIRATVRTVASKSVLRRDPDEREIHPRAESEAVGESGMYPAEPGASEPAGGVVVLVPPIQ